VVRELTGGDGAEPVVDAFGLRSLPRSVAAAAYIGPIMLIGAIPATEPLTDPFAGKCVDPVHRRRRAAAPCRLMTNARA
jgi:NADPH:quinone reductase-like Zn-dependent oxidoreductase